MDGGTAVDLATEEEDDVAFGVEERGFWKVCQYSTEITLTGEKERCGLPT